MSENKTLLTFRWLNATQFLGALNDNIFKFLIVFFLIDLLGVERSKTIQGIAGLIFVVPFLVFSHAAGVLADRYSKRTIIVGTKIFEIGVMCLGALSFWIGAPAALYSVLFLMAVQSAFFGPSKFGIIPELVASEQISKANSLLVSFTFFAIIIGTGSAPLIAHLIAGHYEIAGLFCAVVAVIGVSCSLRIARTHPKESSQELTVFFLRDIWRTLKDVYQDKYLFGAVIGGSYFWLVGAYVQLNIIPFGIEVLGLSAKNSAYLFLLTAIGIAIGSSLAGKLSGRNIEFGVVPLGAFGMASTCILLNFIPREGYIFACFVIVLMGISAGLFIVPLASFTQFRSPENRRGEILATANFTNFTGILLAAALILGFTHIFGFTAAEGFLVIGLVTLGLMVVSLIVLPDFLLRFIALLFMRVFYRLRVKGAENIPLDGPALLVSNHISWVDALLITATSQRRIRFMMERKYYGIRWLNPLMRLMKAIPISMHDSPKKVLRSLKEARKALDEGYLVCIFAEGQISRTGAIAGFRKGFKRIVKGSNYPIIPVYIGGAWGSVFSYYNGKPFSSMPLTIPYPITIIFGKPMPASSSATEVRSKVTELTNEMFELQKPLRRSLAALFIRVARDNKFRPAIADSSGKRLTYGKALISALILAKKIKGIVTDQEKIGILLPASTGAALSNIAVSLLGKIPVNLNFTAGNPAIQSAIQQCRIKTIISSRIFMNSLNSDIKINRKTIFLEDVFTGLSLMEKGVRTLQAFFLPIGALDKNPRNCADDLATIIFSSGSVAEPKGVMLTHHNIISNVESLRMVFRVGLRDSICAALPFFHSFGYTGTLWFPLISGFSACYHPNPMDGKKIAEIVRAKRATILMATPTFLTVYLRKATKEDFGSLRYVVVGAEKLKSKLAEAFQKKFGIQPLEGYGATELSPIASVNVPNVKLADIEHIGLKEGSVGQALPGVVTKIVDPDSHSILPVNSPGLLLVKGPNVMKGYLSQPEKTAEVLNEGWYNTGDIATIDDDGFITITDRLSRFSKIGGEMVPHVAVENAYLNGLNVSDQILAVTSVPDERKGEKLVVCYLEEAGTPEELHRLINRSDLPNLWKPRLENYIKIRQMPLLGSGKLDLKALKGLATQSG